MKIKLLLLLFFLFSLPFIQVNAQIGGNNTYEFLNLVSSARVAALGGNLISVKDNDANLGYHNPSLLNTSMHRQLLFNYVNYFAGINYGYAGYVKHYSRYGTYNLGMHYTNYGKFTQADPTSQITGQFTAGEYALQLGWGIPIDSFFSVGANLKTIYSSFYEYSSFGVAADMAATYHNKEKQFTATIVAKNIGAQIKPYRKGNREPLPIEVQAGISKKLAKAPFRISVIAENLEKWDLSYKDTTAKSSTLLLDPTEEQKEKKKVGDKIMRHIVIGGEFLITPNFNLRVGFNYQRRQELKVDTRPGLAGFSFGVGVKIAKFHISYGLAKYHLAGSSHHFSISTNLAYFTSKTSRVNKIPDRQNNITLPDNNVPSPPETSPTPETPNNQNIPDIQDMPVTPIPDTLGVPE